MTNNWATESGPGFWRNFDRAGNVELVVRRHWGKRPTPNVQRPTPNERSASERDGRLLLFFFEKADVAAAFQTRQFDRGNVFGPGREMEIFVEVVFGDESLLHFLPIDLTVPHQSDR